MFTNISKEKTLSNLNKTNEDLHSAANHAGQAVRGMIDTAGGEAAHMSDWIKAEIRTNPLRSGAIALGVGAFIGLLLRR